METFLVICPTHRDIRELALLARTNVNFIFHDYASLVLDNVSDSQAHLALSDPLLEIDHIIDKVKGITLAGVVSTDDYPGSIIACVVAQRLRLRTPAPKVNLTCQHKYLSRKRQRQLVPDAVPAFSLLGRGAGSTVQRQIGFPAFVKPVKSFFSIGAQRVDNPDQVRCAYHRWADLSAFFSPFDKLLAAYTESRVGDEYLVGEELLRGVQVTVEGYAFGSCIHILGIVDSVMFPGTLAFKRFEYPSAMANSVQTRLVRIARDLMQGLGFRDGMFNVEFMYDPALDRISVIEINPRMASQFADLYEKVDGINSYDVLLDLAAGRAPVRTCRQGVYRFAASCVLRIFEDQMVLSVPTASEIEAVEERFPGTRVEILATEGTGLSSEMQDGVSYRYGVINLGGSDRFDVLRKLDQCLAILIFNFAPFPSLRPGFGPRVTSEPDCKLSRARDFLMTIDEKRVTTP